MHSESIRGQSDKPHLEGVAAMAAAPLPPPPGNSLDVLCIPESAPDPAPPPSTPSPNLPEPAVENAVPELLPYPQKSLRPPCLSHRRGYERPARGVAKKGCERPPFGSA